MSSVHAQTFARAKSSAFKRSHITGSSLVLLVTLSSPMRTTFDLILFMNLALSGTVFRSIFHPIWLTDGLWSKQPPTPHSLLGDMPRMSNEATSENKQTNKRQQQQQQQQRQQWERIKGRKEENGWMDG